MKIHTVIAALMVPATIVLATGGTTACGKDACEEAADIAEDCAPPAGSSSSSSGTTTPSKDAECTGQTETAAKCITENKDAFCAFIKNPIAEASNQDNAYIKCSSALSTQ